MVLRYERESDTPITQFEYYMHILSCMLNRSEPIKDPTVKVTESNFQSVVQMQPVIEMTATDAEL